MKGEFTEKQEAEIIEVINEALKEFKDSIKDHLQLLSYLLDKTNINANLKLERNVQEDMQLQDNTVDELSKSYISKKSDRKSLPLGELKFREKMKHKNEEGLVVQKSKKDNDLDTTYREHRKIASEESKKNVISSPSKEKTRVSREIERIFGISRSTIRSWTPVLKRNERKKESP